MHYDYNANGMNDFMCTFANSFFIRDKKLISHYIMRSNDSVFGYNNDYAWARHVQTKLADDLGVTVGDLIWTASNLHVYERHFSMIEEMNV
jgi:thymidylate synthase